MNRVNSLGVDAEDPYPSLSGFHDHEPKLEFDDAELLERKPEPEVDLDDEQVIQRIPGQLKVGGSQLNSPMSDGTIEKDFSLAFNRDVEITAGQLGSPCHPGGHPGGEAGGLRRHRGARDRPQGVLQVSGVGHPWGPCCQVFKFL